MKKYTFSGDVLVEEVDIPGVPQKSVYTIAEFIGKITSAKLREIQAALPTNDDLNYWYVNAQLLVNVDLNDLPDWFMDGMQALVDEGIYTQAQIEAFLEI